METERRLIDANALKKKAIRVSTVKGMGNKEHCYIKAVGTHEIDKAPTVDAAEVVHARWVDNHCTACGMMPMGDELWTHLDADPPKMEWFMDYCPCCGAKMDGGTDND